MSDGGRRDRPATLGDVLARMLETSGIADRVEQAGVLPEWPGLVGEQIAAVTEPQSVSADGTLWVAVRTHAWMTELQLLEPQLLTRLNERAGRSPIRRIRWRLQR